MFNLLQKFLSVSEINLIVASDKIFGNVYSENIDFQYASRHLADRLSGLSNLDNLLK